MYIHIYIIQLLSCDQPFVIPWAVAHQASLFFTISQSWLKITSIESVMSSNHLILCHPLLFLPFSLSQHQGLFQWVSSSNQVAKVLELQFQHQSFQWLFKVDFLKTDGFDLLSVQGTGHGGESSDKTWSTGEENGKPLQHSCLRTPWTVWKGKKIYSIYKSISLSGCTGLSGGMQDLLVAACGIILREQGWNPGPLY